MSRHYIGDTIDIHGGGADLVFPHHENEIAQSECATGCALANIWMHNGMLNVDNKKMSKSAGNFFLVRDMAKKFGYEPIRFMLLSVHYRSQLNYTVEVIESCKAALTRLYNCKELMERTLPNALDGEAGENTLNDVKAAREEFCRAMDDDFNTADAIAAVFELVRKINTAVSSPEISKGDIKAFSDEFSALTNVLGLLYNKNNDDIPDDVKALVEQRAAARKEKNFALADELRNKITEMGYVVEETKQGTVVKAAP